MGQPGKQRSIILNQTWLWLLFIIAVSKYSNFQVFSSQTQLECLKKAQNERVEFTPKANETDFTVVQLFTFLNNHRFDSVFNLLSIMKTTTISLQNYWYQEWDLFYVTSHLFTTNWQGVGLFIASTLPHPQPSPLSKNSPYSACQQIQWHH